MVKSIKKTCRSIVNYLTVSYREPKFGSLGDLGPGHPVYYHVIHRNWFGRLLMKIGWKGY